ncbi:MAG: sensor histidine kinase [Candidatus Levyibacteriota bacterium]
MKLFSFDHFENARLKLTAWYCLFIMFISVLFSVVIFTEANRELTHFERIQRTRVEYELSNPQTQRPPTLNPQEISDARMRLLFTLILVDAGILVFSGFAGYFLAGRTLKPIKKNMEEQYRFVTDASHELRTPLTSLRSEIEVGLRSKNLAAEEARLLLESNLEEVIALQALSNNLLELSQNGNRIDASLMRPVPLERVIAQAIKKVDSLAHAKQIKIENKIKNATVKGIEDRLVELFVILLDNAIKYSPKKKTVTVSSKIANGKVEISVIDRGIGISGKDILHIFDRFYRAESSKFASHGYGLGLSIAKKITESHNGTITVTSEPDKNTTFTVSLITRA